MIDIHSPRSFSFAGQMVTIDEPHAPPEHAQGEGDGSALVRQLMAHLYHHCYCRPLRDGTAIALLLPDPDELFVKQLAEANTSCSRLSRSWQVLRLLPGGHWIARKKGVVRTLTAGQCSPEPGAAATLVEEGALVTVDWPRESTAIQPGFYFAFGEAIGDQQDDADLLKVYWNVTAGGAPLLVHVVTERLNRFRIPFRLKCLSSPAAYTRADAGVLFINKRFFTLSAVLLAEIHPWLEASLESDVPLFTKRLAHGLGLAEEPDNGESFGQQRCRLLAEALWNAHQLDRRDEHGRLEEVAKHFERQRICLEMPYLNPGSVDRYEWPGLA